MRVLVARIYAFHTRPKERGVDGERVRTYHEPDNRVTDHASGFRQTYSEVVGKGDLAAMIEARCRFMIERADAPTTGDL